MAKLFSLGVLGVGRMGMEHCRQILETPGLRLAAASSRAEQRVREAEKQFGIRCYRRHEDLLRDPQLQWVVIATTSDQHARWALEAIACGKELIIEKPVALSYRETEEIFSAAEKRGLRVTVYQSRRWDRDFELVRELLREGLLGEVYRIESRRTSYSAGWGGWGAQGMENPWRLKKSYGGGMLNDWAPHLVDQLLLLVPSRPVGVFAWAEGRLWTREVDDHFWAEIRFADGLSARVEASNNHRLPLPRWCLVGSAGTLQVGGGGSDSWNEGVLRREFHGIPEQTRFDISQSELASGFYPCLAEALAEGRPLPVQPGEVLAVMELIEAIKASAAAGKEVTLT